MTETYEEKLAQLAALRQQTDDLENRMRDMLEALHENPAYQEASRSYQETVKKLMELEQSIRCQALAAYRVDKRTHRLGVLITRLPQPKIVYNQGTALAWMRESAPDLLHPNWTGFEKRAVELEQSGHPLPFVKIQPGFLLTARIQEDLSPFIKGENSHD